MKLNKLFFSALALSGHFFITLLLYSAEEAQTSTNNNYKNDMQAPSTMGPYTWKTAPLEFISPSIRAFERPYFKPIEDDKFQLQRPFLPSPITPEAEPEVTSGERPPYWKSAPLEFISPSIRAFPIITGFARTGNIQPFAYNISGYIKNESFWDSYQVVGEREDEFLLFPDRPKFDRCCTSNINSKGSYDMLIIESRVRGEIAGPYIFGANTYGVFEIDAWAEARLQLGLLRVRHAFIYFDWKDKILLLGQYWHPVTLPECFADTIGFNAGSPIEPFAREPQMRLVKEFGNSRLLLAMSSHATSPYDGPDGPTTLYSRNAIMPTIDLQVHNSIGEHILGWGVDVFRLVPRLVTKKNICVTESLVSFLVFTFASLSWERYNARLKLIYAQNGQGYAMISGYAVSCIDPYTDERHYTNLQCLSLWLDTAYKQEVEPGLFIGITKNIGANRPIIPCIVDPETKKTESLIYSYDMQNIDYVFRVAPRIRWFIKPFIFGAELEYTRAGWGTVTTSGRVINPIPTNNVRVMLATYYVF